MNPYYTEVMSETPFVEVEHTADWSIHIKALDMEGLLMNASRGMFDLMQIERDEQILGQERIEIYAHDREELLVSWLEELLFHIETRRVAFVINNIIITKDQHHVEASVNEYRIAKVEKIIKAVTYHGLQVAETEEGIEATIVFDV